MLDPADLDHHRARLRAELEALDQGDALGAESQNVVALDQQSVGRLSRMDALQQQAMAQANARRRAARRRRIAAALDRIAENEFGYCIDCGDEIAARRLDLDSTVPTCISCSRN